VPEKIGCRAVEKDPAESVRRCYRNYSSVISCIDRRIKGSCDHGNKWEKDYHAEESREDRFL